MKTRKLLSIESWIIIFVGLADLSSTLYWVYNHGAQEANPIFARYLEMGPVYFSLMKCVMLGAPIFLLEWARRRRPKFATFGSRFAILAYIVMYGVGVANLNKNQADIQTADRLLQAMEPGDLQLRKMQARYRLWGQRNSEEEPGKELAAKVVPVF